MSRVIVKNIPTHIKQADLIEHFSRVGIVTDCKIKTNQYGNSRRFGFIGFKELQSSQKAIKQLNNTYLGISKIFIEEALIRQHLNQQNNNQNNKTQKEKIKQNKKVQKKFKQFKQLIRQTSKKSWDDMLAPENHQIQGENLRKKQKKHKKIIDKEQVQVKQPIISKEVYSKIQNIKAPQLSEKNKNYVTKPLGIDQSRLYITNLPYQLTDEQLKRAFEKFGTVSKLKLPRNQDGTTKGYAFVSYSLPQEALRAFSKLDNTILFGRIIHLKPSLEDIGQIIRTKKQIQYEKNKEQKYGDRLQEKTSYKKKKKSEMRNKLNDTTSWNTLFLNPNTILERMSHKLGITKSEILLSDNLATKIALAEAQIIEQTKLWMKSVGVNLQFLSLDRSLCERSNRIIIVKNLNYRTVQSDLRELFTFYGVVRRVLMAPNRSIGLVEFENENYASNAFQKLQNYKFKNNFLYLEYAPIGMMELQKVEKDIVKEQKINQEIEQLSKVVYVKNLSFDTDEAMLRQFLLKNNKNKETDQIKSVKIIRSKENKSMGYGFVQFSTAQIAQKVIKQFQNQILDGHKIILSMSIKKSQNLGKAQKLRDKLKDIQIPNNKLIIRNIAFQAQKSDIQDLFKEFGTLKKVRLPKKMDGNHRGFGFVQFQSLEEAALAKQALGNSHLYGRRLVIQYEKSSKNQ